MLLLLDFERRTPPGRWSGAPDSAVVHGIANSAPSRDTPACNPEAVLAV
jgi:hypothetical protein